MNIAKINKKYAASSTLLIMILCQILMFNNMITYKCLSNICGILFIYMLIVPCGIKKINNIRYLWYARQILVFTMGVSFFVRALLISK